MSSLPSTSGRPISPRVSENVILGSLSFMSVLLRATAGEIYKIQRRAMSKILLVIGASLIIIAFSFVALTVLFAGSGQHCRAVNGNPVSCRQPTSAEIATIKAQAAEPLHLPSSLTTSVGVVDVVGLVLIIILTGTVVGGEYGVGTIRVLLTRGPTRTQYLLAKLLAILVSIVVMMVIMITLGMVVGALYNLLNGISVDFGFLTADWVLHAIIYLLLETLKLFTFAIIALWLATLGKSSAAGIAGGILWWLVLEGVLSGILMLVGALNPGTVGDILKAIPDYFLGNNFSTLLTEQSDYLTSSVKNAVSSESGGASTIPDWRAWLVIAAYLVVFLGTTWWVLRRRDITN